VARARGHVLSCVLLSLALAGCARFMTGEGTASAAKTRVRFILQTIKDSGGSTGTVLQAAICRWEKDKAFIADRDELGAAADAFDAWRQQGQIYPTLQSFQIDDEAEGRRGGDPENTYYLAVTIDGATRQLRVPPRARISWVDGAPPAAAARVAAAEVSRSPAVAAPPPAPAMPPAPASQTPAEVMAELRLKQAESAAREAAAGVQPPDAPPDAAPAPPPVAPSSDAEMRRKRAEWEEHLRMTEQAQTELQEWRRSRRSTEQAMPRVGVAQPQRAAVEPADAMRAWYRSYTARSTAMSLALSQFGLASGASPPDPPRLLAACRDLRGAARALLADPQALAAPLDSVSAPLTTAYTELEATAASCLAARAEEQAAHLAAARRAMSEAAAALRPYHMAP